jgi:hypothetical protein
MVQVDVLEVGDTPTFDELVADPSDRLHILSQE